MNRTPNEGQPYDRNDLPGKLRNRIVTAPVLTARRHQLVNAGRNPDTPCWLWTMSRNNSGYGAIKHSGKIWMTHILAWHLLVEALPHPGKRAERDPDVLDHLCSNRACMNPHHIEKISQSENTLRGDRHK